MKKIGLISLLALLVSVIVIGCGNNSKLDPLPVAPTNGYMLTNVTAPFDIGFAGQEKDFQVQLLKDGLPVSGKTVMTVSLPDEYGFIAETSVATNAGGYAVFHYTAADPLVNGQYQLALIHDDENKTRTATYLDINIQEGSVPFDYKFVNTTTPILINKGAQKAEISTYLVDENNNGVVGELVRITPVALEYGELATNVAITEEESGSLNLPGKATFEYTAPLHLTDIAGTSTYVTLSYSDGLRTITSRVEIQISGGCDAGYQLINAKNPYNINSATETTEFDIQLTNNCLPVIDARPCTTDTSTVSVDCVMPYVIDRKFGRLQGIDTSGDQRESDGYIYYRYLAPAPDEKAANGEDTTFTVIYIDLNGKIAAESETILLKMRY